MDTSEEKVTPEEKSVPAAAPAPMPAPVIHVTKVGSNSFMDKYMTPLSVLIGAIIIAGALVFGLGHYGSPAQPVTANGQAAAPAVAVNIKNVKTAGEPYVGNANAPVTMALFFDYQCPFCKELDTTVTPQLYTNYVQTGKLKIVFKDFQFLGPDSLTGAEFARAVWQAYPNQFYAWYQAVFAAQGQESEVAETTYLPGLEKITATVPGIDVNKVVALMNQNKTTYDTAIAADRTEGSADGVQGTPSIIIGTTLLDGVSSYQQISSLIDAQLKK
jgi:protein-disulfide isomerase